MRWEGENLMLESLITVEHRSGALLNRDRDLFRRVPALRQSSPGQPGDACEADLDSAAASPELMHTQRDGGRDRSLGIKR